jgi:hypothetical protein
VPLSHNNPASAAPAAISVNHAIRAEMIATLYKLSQQIFLALFSDGTSRAVAPESVPRP